MWNEGFRSWDEALDTVGMEFQQFRKQKEVHKPELLAAFGLPIRFRNRGAQLVRPQGLKRAASLLQIRVIPINRRYHPLVWRAAGPLVPGAQPPKLEYKGDYSEQPPKDWDQALNKFLRKIGKPCGESDESQEAS